MRANLLEQYLSSSLEDYRCKVTSSEQILFTSRELRGEVVDTASGVVHRKLAQEWLSLNIPRWAEMHLSPKEEKEKKLQRPGFCFGLP